MLGSNEFGTLVPHRFTDFYVKLVFVADEPGPDPRWASSISGYWRRGRTEETFRQWKQELARKEAEAEAAVR